MVLFACFLFCRSRESSVENPGNNLYVTGLSTRVTRRDLEKHFSSEGKVMLHLALFYVLILWADVILELKFSAPGLFSGSIVKLVVVLQVSKM